MNGNVPEMDARLVLKRREAFLLVQRILDGLNSDADYVNVRVEVVRTDSNGAPIVDVTIDGGAGTTCRLSDFCL